MAYLIEGGLDALLAAFTIHPADKPRRPTLLQVTACNAGRGTEAGIASVEYWRAVEASPSRYLDAGDFETMLAMWRVAG